MFICCNVRKQTNSNADISEMVSLPVFVCGRDHRAEGRDSAFRPARRVQSVMSEAALP